MFHDEKKQFKLPFYPVADFESFLTPIEDNDGLSSTRVIDEHCVSGFNCYRVTEHPKYQTEPIVYSGKDVMPKFYDHMMQESSEMAKSSATTCLCHHLLQTSKQSSTTLPFARTATNRLQKRIIKYVTTAIPAVNSYILAAIT